MSALAALSDDLEAFRVEAREWLAKNFPPNKAASQ